MTQENQIVSRLFFKSSLLLNNGRDPVNANSLCDSYASNESFWSTSATDGAIRKICFKKLHVVEGSDFFTTEITISTRSNVSRLNDGTFTLTITNSNFKVFGGESAPISISIRLTSESALTMTASSGAWIFRDKSQGNKVVDFNTFNWKGHAFCSFPVNFWASNMETVLYPYQLNDPRLSTQGSCEINGEMIEKILSEIAFIQ